MPVGDMAAWEVGEAGAPALSILVPSAGSHAELDTELDAQQVANIVWSYFTDMRSSAQDTMDQIQESKLSKQIK